MTLTSERVCFDVLLVAVGSFFESLTCMAQFCTSRPRLLPGLCCCSSTVESLLWKYPGVALWTRLYLAFGPELTPDPEPNVGNVTHITVQRWWGFPPVMGGTWLKPCCDSGNGRGWLCLDSFSQLKLHKWLAFLLSQLSTFRWLSRRSRSNISPHSNRTVNTGGIFGLLDELALFFKIVYSYSFNSFCG